MTISKNKLLCGFLNSTQVLLQFVWGLTTGYGMTLEKITLIVNSVSCLKYTSNGIWACNMYIYTHIQVCLWDQKDGILSTFAFNNWPFIYTNNWTNTTYSALNCKFLYISILSHKTSIFCCVIYTCPKGSTRCSFNKASYILHWDTWKVAGHDSTMSGQFRFI